MFKYALLSIFTAILISCTLNAQAQHYFRISNHRNIHLSPAERKIDATIIIATKYPKNNHKLYYWFDNSYIHHTQGGSGGYLLDGDYAEYSYPGNNLLTKGKFKKGLKNGIWYEWYDNGGIKEKSAWKRGYLSGKKYYYSLTGAIYKVEKYRKNRLNGFTVECTSDTLVNMYFYRNGKVSSPSFWNNIGISYKRKHKEKQLEKRDSIAGIQNAVTNPTISESKGLPSKKKNGFQRFWSNTKSKWPF